MYHIINNVYLSNLLDAENFSLIQTNDIKVVCRLSDDRNDSIYGTSVKFYNFECEDNIISANDMIKAAKIISSIIDKTDGNVLVHCNEGQSRSVSVIIYYMITRYGCSFDESLAFIKNIKTDVHPNSSFEKKLRTILPGK